MTAPVDPEILTCQQFQAQLPELIGSGKDMSQHPHIQSCELCRALLADLETIAQAARELFPVEEPPEDLWAKLESAIKQEEAAPDAAASDGGDADPLMKPA